ncbi:hypothetical protein J2S74_002697 [Evansella vedderi]|uniref:ATP-grasp domain-containing protein n=1 Tax=Evansella vedderi TaxID=38282 RepID=A0ABT9ZVP9_9BACI|nr:YheC/YheD family protein [Evansella vedderi]MDQ0255315.1 hypothetical protein [Evansella vedderi]
MRFKVLPHKHSSGTMIVNPKTASTWRIPRSGTFHFGLRYIRFILKEDNKIRENEIALSDNIISYLGIVHCNRYELFANKKEVWLGPFIGILVGRKTLQNKAWLEKYSRHYNKLGGMLVAFRSNRIKKRTIKGAMYNPQKKEWVDSQFCYPSSILRRTLLPNKHPLFSIYGRKIANHRRYNKWFVYKKLSTLATIKNHLPKTVLYHNPKDIHELLRRHNKVFIKSINGSSGRGIIKITKKHHYFHVRWRDGKTKVERSLLSASQLKTFLKTKLKPKSYIIQQSIPLMSEKGRKIDFRLIILKKVNGEWDDVGFISKRGRKRSIVSNISSGGIAEMGEITLKRKWNLTDPEVRKMRRHISTLAHEIAKGVEKVFGSSYCELALDLGIDKNSKVWLIEVNFLGDKTIALDAGNRKLYYDTIKTNLLYVKKLAGF